MILCKLCGSPLEDKNEDVVSVTGVLKKVKHVGSFAF